METIGTIETWHRKNRLTTEEVIQRLRERKARERIRSYCGTEVYIYLCPSNGEKIFSSYFIDGIEVRPGEPEEIDKMWISNRPSIHMTNGYCGKEVIDKLNVYIRQPISFNRPFGASYGLIDIG